MKKLIAIAVMIALVVGAAFADSSISGGIDVRARIDGGGGNDATFTGAPAEGYFHWSGRNDEESFGGALRVRVQDPFGIDEGTPSPHTIEAWWKPVDQVKIYLGQNADSLFESVNINHWGYNQGAEGFITSHDWKFWRTIFPAAEDKYLMAFSFYLIDELDLNLIYKFGRSGTQHDLADAISALHLNVGYSIPDVGKILFDWLGPYGKPFGGEAGEGGFGTFGFSFYSGDLVDGLQLHVGFSKAIRGEKNDANKGKTPTHIGAGVHYLGGEWGVKFRAAFTLDGRPGGYSDNIGVNNSGTYIDGASHIVASIMPWYDMGNMKINFDFGMAMHSPKVGDSTLGWWINPYLTVPGGAGKFQIGMKIYAGSNAMSNWDWMGAIPVKDDKVKFALPMRLVFSF